MRYDRLSRPASYLLGLAMMIVWSIAGCGGNASDSVKVTPEAQKKTDEFLQNYQKSMYDKHKSKPSEKNKKGQ
jgi:hypothetical protein